MCVHMSEGTSTLVVAVGGMLDQVMASGNKCVIRCILTCI